MKKLLLASVSVVAFASAAVNASEMQPQSHASALNTMAFNTIDLASIKPVVELTETIQNQVDKAFADEISTMSKDTLFVRNDKRKSRKTTSLRSE
ncbi:hypothetical protein [Alteromonas ponticola]|uniref:Uncharacterized protein n=1 Tax=Alteromonas ponticola TaxID=2720613 RepID=A0ABX1QX19_9ALTE|nr:hypothetical protein [Alteromonas ponticola]NMH58800.1 hypothetical protein [Alteromonas ponticola]